MLQNLKESTARDLAQLLKVDESTISRNLRYLVQQQLVLVKGYLPPKELGGRKTRLLSLNPNWLRVIGLSIEQGQICIIRSNLFGELLSFSSKNINVGPENLNSVINEALQKENFDLLAVALPGLVNASEKKVVFSEALRLENYCLRSITSKPFVLFNDANAAAAAYLSWANNLVYFLLSIPSRLSEPAGLGAGIIINRSIYEGSNNAAGELGEGVPLTNDKSLTLSDLQVSNGLILTDKKILNNFVDHISEKIASTVNLLDPELFVLGGDFQLLGKEILENIIKKVEKQITARKMKNIAWRIDENGSKTVAFGSVIGLLKTLFCDFEFARAAFEERSQKNVEI